MLRRHAGRLKQQFSTPAAHIQDFQAGPDAANSSGMRNRSGKYMPGLGEIPHTPATVDIVVTCVGGRRDAAEPKSFLS